MVLIRRCLAAGALAALALAGCNQSLFDNHGAVDGGGTPDDGLVAATCPAPCVADASADFDGTPGGAGNRWRYLDDLRNRQWMAMTGDQTTRTGADPANHISTCAANPRAPACVGLPGALLISSAGATSPADPAIELTISTKQVIQLSLRALVAEGTDQEIRLYRNSREDVLVTATAAVGVELDRAITLDALPGDRFLVAVAPTAAGADVAVQLFANTTGAAFPAACQLGISFSAADGNTVDNLCGADFTHALYSTGDTPPPLADGPYGELGKAADVTSDAYFEGQTILDKSHDLTVQFWVKLRGFVDTYDTWLFSDLDLNLTGGLGIGITNADPPLLDVQTCTSVTPTTLTFDDLLTPYPNDGGWHFVRATQTNGIVYLCVDGTRRNTLPVAAGFLRSSFPPYLGKNVVWSPAGAYFDGELDDVRVLTGALPCD